MAHWVNGEMLLLDTETDDPDPVEAYLIQVALIHVLPDRKTRRWEWLVKPRRPIPPGATAVHKITTERAEAEGQPVEIVLTELAIALDAWNDRNVLIGHNVCYDLTVCDREQGRVLGGHLPIRGPVIDTLLIDKCVDKWRSGSRKLTDQCKHYKVELIEAHNAFADALAAGRLAWRLATTKVWPRGRYGPSASEREARELVARGDAQALHDAQVLWHEESQLGLAEYFRTPKAIEAIEKKVAAGEVTREAADARIAAFPVDADRIEASARGGWPMLPRVPAAL